MPNVTVQKTDKPAGLPVFEELNRRFEEIRKRAFELFEARGADIGRDLDDWFQAEQEVLGPAKVELADNDGAYRIEVALPGFEPKDIEVTATPGEIVLQAQQRRESGKDVETKQVYRRWYLPEISNVDRIQASLDKGTLHITAPKVPEKKETPPGRRIDVAA